MSLITRFVTINSSSGGSAIQNLLGQGSEKTSGIIHQVLAVVDSGSATSINVKIGYFSDDFSTKNLVYYFSSGILPFVDSDIRASFSLKNSDLRNDLYLYTETNVDSTITIRVDIEII